jgi:ArsR family transcriptional regulator
MRLVERQELSVGEIAAVLQLPQSTTSRHLKALSDETWLCSRREGTSRLYRLLMDQLPPKKAQLWSLLRDDTPDADSDDRRLAQVLHARQSRSQEFFEGAALRWGHLRGELFGEHLDRSLLPALLSPDTVVADLGCGTAGLSELLSPFVRRVVAVDSSAAMIAAARERLPELPNVELITADLRNVPLAGASVDVALLVLVLHYIATPEEVIAEAHRILRPGGRLIIVDMQPHSREEYRVQMGHQWLGFGLQPLQSWCNAGGFRDVRYTPLAPDPSAKGPPLFVSTACS